MAQARKWGHALNVARAIERIEDLRVSWERELEGLIATQSRGRRSPRNDPGEDEPRLPLHRSMAERVHRIAHEAAERVGCSDPFFLFLTPRADRRLNAQVLTEETPFAIRLIGPVAGVLDDRALAALIGHELGHWLALGPHANPPSIVLQAWERGAPEALCRLATFATELTADRFSLIAARGELEAAVRLELAVQTLDSPRALGVRELEYLADLRRRLESHEAPVLRFDGYPSSEFRLFATWLFWRSETHQELTRVGPGDLSLRDVDATLRRMCDEELERERPSRESEPIDVWQAGEPTSAPRATSTPASGSIERRAQSIGSSVAARVERAVTAVVELAASRTSRSEKGVSVPADGIDDVEARFRELERQAGAREPEGPRSVPVDDLEARFRDLERRERSE